MTTSKKNPPDGAANTHLREMSLVYTGAAVAFGLYVLLTVKITQWFGWHWLYDDVELVGPVAVLLLVGAMAIAERVHIGEQWGQPAWRYVRTGFVGTLLMLPILPIGAYGLIAVSVILPGKLLWVWVLGQRATIISALVVFPVVFFTVSVAFSVLYMSLIVQRQGNLTTKTPNVPNPIYGTKHIEPWPRFREIYYFSVATMLKGPQRYEPTGGCRWVALLQILTSRLLEIAIVSIGLSVIVRRVLTKTP